MPSVTVPRLQFNLQSVGLVTGRSCERSQRTPIPAEVYPGIFLCHIRQIPGQHLQSRTFQYCPPNLSLGCKRVLTKFEYDDTPRLLHTSLFSYQFKLKTLSYGSKLKGARFAGRRFCGKIKLNNNIFTYMTICFTNSKVFNFIYIF